jgi:PAS domain S-box-containing protein
MLTLLKDLFGNSLLGILITDVDLINGPNIIYVNPKIEILTGYKFEELIGKTPRILQGEKTVEENKKNIKESLLNHQPYVGCVINYRKDGSEYFVRLNINKMRIENIDFYLAIQYEVPEMDVINFLRDLEETSAKILSKLENAGYLNAKNE